MGAFKNLAIRMEEGNIDPVKVREILERCYQSINAMLLDVGGCDHSVGICCCEDIRLAEDIRELLFDGDTCRNCYRTDCRCAEIRAKREG